MFSNSDHEFCSQYHDVGFSFRRVMRWVRSLVLIALALGLGTLLFFMSELRNTSFVTTFGAVLGLSLIVLMGLSLIGAAVLAGVIVGRVGSYLAWSLGNYRDVASRTGLKTRFCWNRLQTILEGTLDGRFMRVHRYNSNRRRRFLDVSPKLGAAFEILIPLHRILPSGSRIEARGRDLSRAAASSHGHRTLEEWEQNGLELSALRGDEFRRLMNQESLRWVCMHLSTSRFSWLNERGLALSVPRSHGPDGLVDAVSSARQAVRDIERAIDLPWEVAARSYGLNLVSPPPGGHPVITGWLSERPIRVWVASVDTGIENDYETNISLILPESAPDWSISTVDPDQGIRTGNPVVDGNLGVRTRDGDRARALLADSDLSGHLLALLGEYPGSSVTRKWIRVTVAGDAGPRLSEILGDIQTLLDDLRRLGAIS